MSRRFLVAGALALALAGCAQRPCSFRIDDPTDGFTGPGGGPDSVKPVKLHATFAVLDPAVEVPAGGTITTPSDLKASVEFTSGGITQDYALLIGPYPAGGPSASGAFDAGTRSWGLWAGYGYFYGGHPYCKTDRTFLITYGTKFIVQSDATFERIIMLDHPPVGASVTSNPRLNVTLATVTLNLTILPGQYCIVPRDGNPANFVSPTNLPADPAHPINVLKDFVLRRASVAGL